MKKVVILPWVHDVRQGNHQDIIRLLEDLPRGARILVEIDEEGKKVWEAMLSSRRSAARAALTAHTSGLAILEILRTIAQRQHRMETMEGMYYYPTQKLLEESPGTAEEYIELHQRAVRIDRKREETFAARIKTALFREKRTLFVLCGLDHANRLNQLLQQQGIESEIATQFFTRPKHIQKMLENSRKMEAAVKNKNEKEVDRLLLDDLRQMWGDREVGSLRSRARFIIQQLRWLKNRRIRATREYGLRRRKANKTGRPTSTRS